MYCKSFDDTTACSDYLRKRSDCLLANYQSSYECIEKVNVDIIEQSLKRMKLGKAAGPDDVLSIYTMPIPY